MSIWLAVLLLILALVFVFLEFIIPSGGLITVLSIVCFVGSLAIAGMNGMGYFAGFLLAIIFLVPIVLILAVNIFPKTPVGKAMILKPPESSSQTQSQESSQQVSVPDYSYLLGKKGITESLLRPAGIANIEGERVNVVSDGEVIEKDTEVVVVKVDGYRIVVKPVDHTSGE